MSDSQKMNEITNGLVSNLPEGWIWCRMDEIAKINPRHPLNVFPENIEASFLPMPNLNEDSWKIKENQTRPLGEIRKGYTHFAEDDVLFAKITPCMENGKAAIARNLVNRIGCGTTELHVIRPHGGIPPEFIYYYIHQESFRQEAEACMTGTAGQLRVPVDFVASASIPIPPLQEQILIVNRIELLLERTKKAKESLEKIPQIMKRFRQAALKKAFSGELTVEWREQQQDLEPAAELLKRIQEERKPTKKPKSIGLNQMDISGLSDLPDEWCWTTLGSISEIAMGQSPPGKSYNFSGNGVPLINGPVEFGSTPFSKTIKAKFTTSPTKMCRENDLIVCVRGSTTGRMNISGFDACIGRGVAAMRSLINQSYLNLYVHSIERQILELGNGSTFPNVQGEVLGMINIPIPPLPEQQEIVHRIESLFKFADETEKNAAEARKRVEIMTQSILARAFRGDLSVDFREAVRNWKDLDPEARGRYIFCCRRKSGRRFLLRMSFRWSRQASCWSASGKRGKRLSKESNHGKEYNKNWRSGQG